MFRSNGANLMLSLSEKESKRFGLSVYRSKLTNLDERALTKEVLSTNADLVILRLPASEQHRIHRLSRVGMPYVVADTLVYYKVDLHKWERRELRNSELKFAKIDRNNISSVDEMVPTIFAEYKNHYSSNPFISKDNLIDGYKEWANTFAGTAKGNLGWLVLMEENPIGFCLCSQDSEVAEGVLYGVMPAASGMGVYGDMIRFTQNYFRETGVNEFKVSTQTQNIAVQKVWSREGFVISDTFITLHLNSMLSRSVVEPLDISVRFSGSDVDRFALLSGDTNPLHLDKNYCSDQGFEDRIVHGAAISGLLSKFYGTDVPGPGTLFKDFKYSFLGPVYIDREYCLKVTFPFYAPETGVALSVARLQDSSGETKMIAYSTLKLQGTSPSGFGG